MPTKPKPAIRKPRPSQAALLPAEDVLQGAESVVAPKVIKEYVQMPTMNHRYPPDLFKAAKLVAKHKGISLNEYVMQVLKVDVKNNYAEARKAELDDLSSLGF